MAKIIQTRIDERLLHGQASIWLQVNHANTVIVANNESANNKIKQNLMSATVPEGRRIRFYTLDKLIEIWPQAAKWQIIYFIIGSIDDLFYLWAKGIPFWEINIGNIHAKPNKKRITGAINLAPEEQNKIRKMYEAGVKFNTQTLPNMTKGLVEIDKLIN